MDNKPEMTAVEMSYLEWAGKRTTSFARLTLAGIAVGGPDYDEWKEYGKVQELEDEWREFFEALKEAEELLNG